MRKSYIAIAVGVIGLLTFVLTLSFILRKDEIFEMNGTIIAVSGNRLTIQDDNNAVYTISYKSFLDLSVGDRILIEYTGLINSKNSEQDIKIINYTKLDNSQEEEKTVDGIPESYLDDGLFKQYYKLAWAKLETMSLEEKIGQLILARYDKEAALDNLNKYYIGGYIFFESDFTDKSVEEVQDMIKGLQDKSKIPLLTAVDEEGGSVSRLSKNSNLVSTPFKSPQDLYSINRFTSIEEDTINKSKILKNLGLNVNLAPVVDVAVNSSSYIYNRTIGLDTAGTSEYAKTVIKASQGTNVSYVLKHFPGYGDAMDSHSTVTRIDTTYDQIVKDYLPPFKAGIEQKAEAVLVNHNIYENVDASNPASLSPIIHNLLRENLGFTGVIMTDNLDMDAVNGIDNAEIQALLAGNDILITTDYQENFTAIKEAVTNKTISEDVINKKAFKVLAWKYYKGLMFEEKEK